MRLICVDDEKRVLSKHAAMCRRIPEVTDVRAFSGAADTLLWLKDHACDIALLDINMPGMDGLVLAQRIRELHPHTVIIFVSEHPEFAINAFRIRATGYIVKPMTQERLESEIGYALTRHPVRVAPHVAVQTFGGFDVLVDGDVVNFSRSKAKEILAYLVDRQGKEVTRAQVYSFLWEDMEYDRAAQKQLDVMIRSLRTTLNEYGISEIIDMGRGKLRVVPENFTCDLYRYLDGDTDAVNAYRGEYMSSYSWASITEAYMDRMNGSL